MYYNAIMKYKKGTFMQHHAKTIRKSIRFLSFLLIHTIGILHSQDQNPDNTNILTINSTAYTAISPENKQTIQEILNLSIQVDQLFKDINGKTSELFALLSNTGDEFDPFIATFATQLGTLKQQAATTIDTSIVDKKFEELMQSKKTLWQNNIQLTNAITDLKKEITTAKKMQSSLASDVSKINDALTAMKTCVDKSTTFKKLTIITTEKTITKDIDSLKKTAEECTKLITDLKAQAAKKIIESTPQPTAPQSAPNEKTPPTKTTEQKTDIKADASEKPLTIDDNKKEPKKSLESLKIIAQTGYKIIIDCSIYVIDWLQSLYESLLTAKKTVETK